MIRRFKLFSVFFMTFMMCASFSVNAAEPIQVVIDGNPLEFDVPPTIISGRTMVPMRAIFEALGASVQWDGANSTVTAEKDGLVVKATIGNKNITINGENTPMDIAPVISNGRTLVPARFVSEAFGCDVEWDASRQSVYITSNNNMLPSDNENYYDGIEE